MAGAIDKLHSMCIAVVDGEERAAGGAGGLVQSPSILSDNGTLSDNRMVRVRVCRGAMCVFICVCVCTCMHACVLGRRCVCVLVGEEGSVCVCVCACACMWPRPCISPRPLNPHPPSPHHPGPCAQVVPLAQALDLAHVRNFDEEREARLMIKKSVKVKANMLLPWREAYGPDSNNPGQSVRCGGGGVWSCRGGRSTSRTVTTRGSVRWGGGGGEEAEHEVGGPGGGGGRA